MASSKHLSLGELETLYLQKIESFNEERAVLVKRLGECDNQLKAYEERLRWVRSMIASPDSSAPLPSPKKKRRRQRHSPVRVATLEVLREHPGQWLTSSQILTAIRRTRRRASRQSVNVNLNQLRQAGQVQRRRAPAGSDGAQYIYSAI